MTAFYPCRAYRHGHIEGETQADTGACNPPGEAEETPISPISVVELGESTFISVGWVRPQGRNPPSDLESVVTRSLS